MSCHAFHATSAISANFKKKSRGNSRNSFNQTIETGFTLAHGNEFALEKLDPRSLTSEDEWLTTEQAAAYLKLSVGSLRNMTSDGQIPHYKLGKRNRYRLSDLRQLLLSEKRGGF